MSYRSVRECPVVVAGGCGFSLALSPDVSVHRSSESLRDRPSAIDSVPKDAKPNARSFCPLHHCEGFAVMSQKSVCETVVALFLSCCPFAVTGFIVAVVVLSLNGIVRTGHQSHIFKERPEILPAITDHDASAAVSFPHAMFGVVTAAQHFSPTGILGTLAYRPRGVAVLESVFYSLTPTTIGFAGSEVTANQYLFVSAGADAFPEIRPALVFAHDLDYSEASESPVGKIKSCPRHDGILV